MGFSKAFLKIFKSRARSSAQVPKTLEGKLPRHIAVIMDGNGRWAKKRGLPRKSGHFAGAENLYNLCSWCIDFDIEYVTVFAFSTENWQRPQKEVEALMDLFIEFFARYDQELKQQDVRLRFMGEIEELPAKVVETVKRAEAESKERKTLQLVVAFNYGGRREISRAARLLAGKCQQGEISLAEISEEAFASCLYLPDLPDPDLLIRPSGEQRLSNFLLWQSAYSEFWYSDVLWPDFSKEDFSHALMDYIARQRRFGAIIEE